MEGADDDLFWKRLIALPGESLIGGSQESIHGACEGVLIESGEAGDAPGFRFGDELPGFGGVGGDEDSGVCAGDDDLCAGGECVDAGFAGQTEV